MQIVTETKAEFIDDAPLEIVERKGAGHPDTLADGLAEAVSVAYSQRCLERYGLILHHNSDKTALLGGAAEVRFGDGVLTTPVRALINGRFSSGLGDDDLGVEELIDRVTREFLGERLPRLDTKHDLVVQTRNNQASSPGHVGGRGTTGVRSRWFAPRTPSDLPEASRLFSNDTSCGVGYAPVGRTELLATGIEMELNSPSFSARHPEYGSDIKVMACRVDQAVDITLCVPQIAALTPDLETYVERKRSLLDTVHEIAARLAPSLRPSVALNTRDDHAKVELYLTATGSSIESGDEGVVGRGNRITGAISVLRPMSAEGFAGKNPVYHIGKLYNVLAVEAANRLYQLTGHPTVVCLVSQSGRDLSDPWIAYVEQARATTVDTVLVKQVIDDVFGSVESIRTELLTGVRAIC
ncbi:methionine adenosyltransferase [Kribbella sancticallisti]|uniref:Methionine adenosyltransferase n=1 Tax=Kribbella sancticallisti TaxID=460087 RepID=A0ABN2ET19_9ACTN